MKKLASLFLAAMMVAALLAGCTNSSPSGGNTPPPGGGNGGGQGENGGGTFQGSTNTGTYDTTYKLGFCVNSMNNPVFVNWINYLKEHAPNYGFEFVYLSSDEDSAKELSNVEDLIGQGCDLIYLSAVNTDAAAAVVRRCNSEGLPLTVS